MSPAAVRFVYDDWGIRNNEVFASRLVAAAHRQGLAAELCVLSARRPPLRLAPVDIAVIRSRVPGLRAAAASSAGLAVNGPKIALVGNDKLALARFLANQRIPHPRTWMASSHPPSMADTVLKPRFGHGGQGVQEGRNPLCGLDSFILQDLVVGAGSDIRVYVAGQEPFACVARSASSGFRSNLRLGASVRAVTLGPEQAALVARLISLLGPGYYGIDLIGPPAEPVVMEIEDVVGARALYTLGIADPAVALARWIASLA